ncbi:hypothetical protein HYW30_01465, partial [Candidatus Azambacteria bacterium]|nr:hypothetical protein [Candidatus Azambacteria bacterium]
FGARLYFIQVKTPEKLILQRLRAQRYPKPGLANLNQALLAYFSRKKFHQKKLRLKPVFVIDNSKLLAPQIARIVKQIKEG